MPSRAAWLVGVLATLGCSDAGTDSPLSAGSAGASAGSAGTPSTGGAAGSAGAPGTAGSGGTSAGQGGTAGQGGGGPCMPATALVCDPMAALPAKLSETGLFPALPSLDTHHERALAFEPSPALWSDGLHKERLVILPEGTQVDTSDAAKWKVPMGTVFVKSFFDDGGPNGAPRPIETRLIRHARDPEDPFSAWQFAVYDWSEDGSDATLVDFSDPMKSTPRQVIVKHMQDGKLLELNQGQPFTHDIPAKQQCQACHDANAKTTESDIIGFDELRLNWKLTGAAATQLEALTQAQVLSKASTSPAKIEDTDPVLARVKSWAYGNCSHCHNGAEGMLDLRPDAFVASTVNQAAQGAGIMVPSDEWKRVVPGKPELSVLFVQARRAPLPGGSGVQMRAMPPLGVAVPEMTRPSAATDPPEYAGQLPPMTLPSTVPSDPLADLATWIRSLE